MYTVYTIKYIPACVVCTQVSYHIIMYALCGSILTDVFVSPALDITLTLPLALPPLCRYSALEKWTSHLQTLHSNLIGRVV